MDEFFSPYLYCGNNPIRYVDPNGMNSDNSVGDAWMNAKHKQISWKYAVNGDWGLDYFEASFDAYNAGEYYLWSFSQFAGMCEWAYDTIGVYYALSHISLLVEGAIGYFSRNPSTSTTVASGTQRLMEGIRREEIVAKLVEGTVSGLRIKGPGNLGSTDIDVISKVGDLISVGGPAKVNNIGNFIRGIRILMHEAVNRGVNVQVYLTKDTPQKVFDAVSKVIDKSNIHTF